MARVAGQLRWDLCDAQAAVAALVERHGLQHDDVVAHLVARGILPRHEDVDEDEDGWEDCYTDGGPGQHRGHFADEWG